MSFKNFYIVLVEPEYEGNIGFVARHMRVFGFENLVLVNPPKIGEEARKRAMKGLDILENAIIVNTIEEALEMVDYSVATSAVTHATEKRHLRTYMDVRDFARVVKKIEGKVGIFFGRESIGLKDSEIEMMDIMVHIPSNPEYPVLNLSHAVTIFLYEIYREKTPPGRKKRMSKKAKDTLYKTLNELIDELIPPHRRTPTKLAFKRVLERAMPTEWEYHRMMGLFMEALRRLKQRY